jgi:digeranylgeranylglycerophospholipid reductase
MANVGIGVQASRINEPGSPKRYLDKFIAEHPHLSKGCATEAVAGGVSVCAPIDRTVANNVMLVGDSARQIDPMTGGGIANACKAGCVAGRVAAEAVVAKDYSVEFFQRYETGWRDLIENVLWRNYMAKEKVQAMSDETMDKIIESLSEVRIDQLSIFGILDAVRRKYPELVKEFEEFL